MSCVSETDCFTVKWKIVNFSLFSTAGEYPLRSPAFKTETSQGTTWWRLIVNYSVSDIKFCLILYTGGSENDRYEISLLANCCEKKVPFRRKEDNQIIFVVKNYEIFGLNGSIIRPQDTLTVYCRIWQKVIKPEQRLFCTVLHKVNFSWNIEHLCPHHYSSRTVHQQDTLQFIIILYENSEKGTHKLRVETQRNLEGFPLFVNCKLSNKSDHCKIISSNSISPTAGWLWDIYLCHDGTLYLSNINLHFQLESLVAVEMEYQSMSTKHLPATSDWISAFASAAVPRSSLKEDLLVLYRERLHSDATLKAEGINFPTHKNILAARSRVFRAMFEKEQMSEGLSGVVDIEDVDSETLDRMLVFLYSDRLEDIQWEDALPLYYAADKYAIHSLKLRCADILMAGLTVSNVCHLLVLADSHVDKQLMRLVVNFIEDHDEVISSAEWAELEDSNSRLTTKIMRELYLNKISQIQSNPTIT